MLTILILDHSELNHLVVTLNSIQRNEQLRDMIHSGEVQVVIQRAEFSESDRAILEQYVQWIPNTIIKSSRFLDAIRVTRSFGNPVLILDTSIPFAIGKSLKVEKGILRSKNMEVSSRDFQLIGSVIPHNIICDFIDSCSQVDISEGSVGLFTSFLYKFWMNYNTVNNLYSFDIEVAEDTGNIEVNSIEREKLNKLNKRVCPANKASSLDSILY